MTRYILLALAFTLTFAGGALGASANSIVWMGLGMLPGFAGMLGLGFIYRT